MGGRIALEIYRIAPHRVARIALLNTGSSPLAAGAAGEEEARKRSELVALAQSQSMPAMLREWLPPMIAPRRINEIVLGKRDITADTDLRLARYFGMSEGFFLGLQMDYDLMQRRREIDRDLKAIRPRAA